MFTKWKTLAGELYYISCPRSRKLQQVNSTTLLVHEVENFSWETLLYFMSTKWKSLTGEPYDTSCPRIGKV